LLPLINDAPVVRDMVHFALAISHPLIVAHQIRDGRWVVAGTYLMDKSTPYGTNPSFFATARGARLSQDVL